MSLTSALITKVSKINYLRFFTTKEYKMTTSMIGQFQTLREIKTSGPQDATDNTCLLRLLRIFIRKFNTNCNKLTILKKSSSVQIMFYLTFWLRHHMSPPPIVSSRVALSRIRLRKKDQNYRMSMSIA